MTCAIFRNLGNTPVVNDLLIKFDSIGDKRDLIDLITFVKGSHINVLTYTYNTYKYLGIIYTEIKQICG